MEWVSLAALLKWLMLFISKCFLQLGLWKHSDWNLKCIVLYSTEGNNISCGIYLFPNRVLRFKAHHDLPKIWTNKTPQNWTGSDIITKTILKRERRWLLGACQCSIYQLTCTNLSSVTTFFNYLLSQHVTLYCGGEGIVYEWLSCVCCNPSKQIP